MDVVCLGILVADVIARPVDEPPTRGSLSFLEDIGLHGGGCALNTASALVALGLRASVVGKAGADAFGDFLLRTLDERGVRADVIRDATVPTSATVALVDADGERTFLHVPGANGALVADELDPDRLYGGRALHIGGALVMDGLDGDPFAQLLAEAQRRGRLASLVPVWDPTDRWSRLEPCLPHLDLLSMSLVEGGALSGEDDPASVAAWVRERGVRDVALTMGPCGCYASGEGFEGQVAAPSVSAVDGTGAGDAFVAGLLYGKLHDWSLERSARLACAVGALSTLTVGATLGGKGLTDALALAGLE